MQLDVFFLSSLGHDVALDFPFASVATNGADVVSVGPELSAPEVLLDLGYSGEDFSTSNALNSSDNLRGAVRRYRLNEEVHMILVCADLEEEQVIPICYLQTNRLESLIHFREKNRSSVLRRTDKVVEQDRDIVTSMNVFTHTSEYITRTARQAAGNLPLRIERAAENRKNTVT
jgi:hypothetical protein